MKGWLGSRVVNVLDSGAEGPVYTHCACVHQAAKLVAALLRVARVSAGLAKVMAATAGFMTRHLQAGCRQLGSAPEPYTR